MAKYDIKSTYNDLTQDATGSLSEHNLKALVYPFGKYEITVVITATGQFAGISEVNLKKDFLSDKQRLTPQGYHDVGIFYRE